MAKKPKASSEAWQVMIAKNGRTYHRVDGEQVFHSFITVGGSVVDEDASELLRQNDEAEKICLTHTEFAEIVRIVFDILTSEETENE